MTAMMPPVGPAILCLLHWHWHSGSSPSDPEAEAAAAAAVAVALVMFGGGLGFTFMGLLHGGFLLPWVGKKRHLFWAVPAINVVWYFLARACLWSDASPLAQVSLGVPFVVSCGLLSATLLAPFHVLIWRGRRAGQRGLPAAGDAAPQVVFDPVPADEPRLVAFRRGFSAPWEGFGYLCQYPRLWRYGVVPIMLNLIITGAVLLFLLATAVWFVAYLHPLFPAGWGWVVLEVLCAIGILLLAVGLALVAWIFLQGVLCGHYHSRLAREVELQLGLRPDQMQEVSWGHELIDAGRDVVALVGINGGFLLLHVVPVLGSVVGVVGSLYFDWMLFGEEYFDYPLALRGQRRHAKKAFCRQHRRYTLGLGAAAFLASFVPIVGAVLLVTAVVGAVLLHRRLDAQPNAAGAAEAGIVPAVVASARQG